jgi:hypothetical protein
MKPASALPESPSPKSRVRGRYRVLGVLAVFAAIVVFIFPLIFRPGVEPPTELAFASPFSMALLISNQNITPLTDVEYSCEVSNLTLANGSEVKDAKVLVRGSIRKIPGRRAIPGRCETAYIVGAPLKAVEYRLTLNYKTYPWPQRRTAVYRIAAQISGAGQVTGWKVS